ncbi:MAG: glycerol kinase GlpK, partial [Bacteroidota bacterium]
MKGKSYIISIDQGTTSCRALLINLKGQIVGVAQKEFTQIYPKPGWVEHDPMEIWNTQYEMLRKVIEDNNVNPSKIAAIGITNQRETAVVWDKETGEPIYNAIVWQDKRTAGICEKMKRMKGMLNHVRNTTGLVLDSYFSGTKVKWILDNVKGAKAKAKKGKLLFGTVDTWLIWKLTNGVSHKTDYTNASRTLMYDIKNLKWDAKLTKALGVPESMLPKVQASASNFGSWNCKGEIIPIAGVAGDQQSALFGQACFAPGTAKNTYGTGCFLLLNIGNEFKKSKNGLLTTLVCTTNNKVQYAFEGSVFIAGAAIQWLRDAMKVLLDAGDSEYFANKVKDDHDVVVVPAFAGLGAPYWDMYARGAIFGLTRDSSREHVIKATLESLGYQSRDVIDAMIKDSGKPLKTLKVDGGACANNFLMQFQSDILGVPVERPEVIETTAMGAAYLAGIQVGIWNKDIINKNRRIDKTFKPEMEEKDRKQ